MIRLGLLRHSDKRRASERDNVVRWSWRTPGDFFTAPGPRRPLVIVTVRDSFATGDALRQMREEIRRGPLCRMVLDTHVPVRAWWDPRGWF